MSEVAKDASKKVSDAEGGNVFRGITPMLHVVTDMLAATPSERPSGAEVEQRMYLILRDQCRMAEPHCVHRYGADLTRAFSELSLAGAPAVAR